MKEFSKSVKKIVTKKYKPAAKNFFVEVESKGIKSNLGRYYVVGGDNMILTSVVMFNVLNDEPITDISQSWNPIFNARLKGKAGLGLLVKSAATGYPEIFPFDIKNITDFKKFKGIAYNSDRYLNECGAALWQNRFSNTFTPEDLELLLKKYNEKMKSFGTKVKEYKSDPKNYNKELWIKRGYPCAYRYGFAYRGEKASVIDKTTASEKLHKVFESKYEKINGIWHLVLQDYSANDMW